MLPGDFIWPEMEAVGNVPAVQEPMRRALELKIPPVALVIITAAQVTQVQTQNNQSTLAKVAVLPVIMFVCYLGLFLDFKARGGYRPVQMDMLEWSANVAGAPTVKTPAGSVCNRR